MGGRCVSTTAEVRLEITISGLDTSDATCVKASSLYSAFLVLFGAAD